MFPSNFKNESKSVGNPDKSLNSVYSKTMKGSVMFKDENEDMIISQKRPKDKIQKIPQLLKKTENQSVERKTNLEKKIDKNQLKKLQEGNLSTDPKRLTNTNRKKKLKK